MKIGFIGLGNMGKPMAANLAKAGHTLTGFDVMPAVVDGVKIVDSARQAASEQDVVITMLPNGDILRNVWQDIVPVAKAGTCLVDCSTVDVDSARAMHQLAEQAGLLSLDAPVSGGVNGAIAGTLTFMVGGTEQAFGTAKPLLEIMGGKAILCGAAGAGQAAKICNNMILGVSMVAVCEGFSLAEKLGLDKQAMFDVVSTSSGSCWSLNTYCPIPGIGPNSPADNDYQPGFSSALMLKDLTLSQQAAASVNADTPMGEHARKLYDNFANGVGEGKDFSGIFTQIVNKNRAE